MSGITTFERESLDDIKRNSQELANLKKSVREQARRNKEFASKLATGTNLAFFPPLQRNPLHLKEPLFKARPSSNPSNNTRLSSSSAQKVSQDTKKKVERIEKEVSDAEDNKFLRERSLATLNDSHKQFVDKMKQAQEEVNEQKNRLHETMCVYRSHRFEPPSTTL